MQPLIAIVKSGRPPDPTARIVGDGSRVVVIDPGPVPGPASGAAATVATVVDQWGQMLGIPTVWLVVTGPAPADWTPASLAT